MALLVATYCATTMLTLTWEFTFLRIVAMSLISASILASLSWFFAIDAEMRHRLIVKLKSRLPLRH